jgi:hypothetical protein
MLMATTTMGVLTRKKLIEVGFRVTAVLLMAGAVIYGLRRVFRIFKMFHLYS